MAGQGKPENLTNAGKGRKKGSVNKSTRLAKDAISMAAEQLGGEKRLAEWAKEDPENERVFWQSIFTKLVPVQQHISGPEGGSILFKTVYEGATGGN
jgi:hypothetical protein